MNEQWVVIPYNTACSFPLNTHQISIKIVITSLYNPQFLLLIWTCSSSSISLDYLDFQPWQRTENFLSFETSNPDQRPFHPPIPRVTMFLSVLLFVFGSFPGVWILSSDFSEHSVPTSQVVQVGRIFRVKWQERWFGQLPLSRAEVRSECSCKYHPSYAFVLFAGITWTLLLTLNIPRGVLREPPFVCYWLTSVEINKHKLFDTNNAWITEL